MPRNNGEIKLSSKLRIRIGEVEIDYEGTEEVLKQELPELLKTAMELHKAAGGPPTSSDAGKRRSSVLLRDLHPSRRFSHLAQKS